MQKIFFVLILILGLLITIYYFKKYTGVAVYSKGYGDTKDSISTLFQRIDWSNHYKGRDNLYIRHLLYSIAIVFIILSITKNALPEIISYIQGVFIMFVLLQAFNNYFIYHSEKFAHYAIDSNLKLLRKKLKIKREKKITKIWHEKFPGASPCWNFNFKK
jgi:hypothetical protein